MSTEAVRKKKPIAMILLGVLIMISSVGFFSAFWYVRTYGRIGFNAILYTMTSDLAGTESGLIVKYLTQGLLPGLVFGTACCLVIFLSCKRPLISVGKIALYPFGGAVRASVSLLLCLFLILAGLHLVEFPQWLYGRLHQGTLYEEEYVDPARAKVIFPERKRNLIYIILESMECSYMSPDAGGAMPVNLIPGLTRLAQDNLTFTYSEDGLLGGWQNTNGATWTVGSMVAQTAGIPLTIPFGNNEYMSHYSEFLPGAASLMNILSRNGYEQALMVGSDASFGGRREYYVQHGVNRVYDIFAAWHDGIIPQGYSVWWGYEDKYLFEFAKKVLPELAEGIRPFALTLLTVDTHQVGGYKCDLCGDEFEEQYSNVIACSDRQVCAFIEWLQQQDFYENTSVIIVGDHATMDGAYIARNVPSGYTRRVYNCFINCPVEPEKSTGREILPFDMFPTTLAAMGCTIPTERLGLGVNLFSGQPTLAERMGFATVMQRIGEASTYYIEHFMQVQETEETEEP